MRTHKIVFRCNSEEAAKWYEEEILHVDFCDLTHWYCGLDKEGEDTPETCIIYRGIVHPETITVELDVDKFSVGPIEIGVEWLKTHYVPKKIGNESKGYEILKVDVEETESFAELNNVRQKVALSIWPNKHDVL